MLDWTCIDGQLLLAQNEGPAGSFFMITMLLIGAAFYFIVLLPDRKRQARHKQLLEDLKKNDRVVTIGGIYGVVMNVAREADEVTLKVDEGNNTRIKVTFGAINRVIVDTPPAEKPA